MRLRRAATLARFAVERVAHGLKVITCDARRETNGRDSPLARQPSDGRFAHLEDGGKLARGQKLFARLGRDLL